MWGENASVSKHLLVTPPGPGAPRDTNPFLPSGSSTGSYRQLQCEHSREAVAPFPAFLEHPKLKAHSSPSPSSLCPH